MTKSFGLIDGKRISSKLLFIKNCDKELFLTFSVLLLSVVSGVVLYMKLEQGINSEISLLFREHLSIIEEKSKPVIFAGMLLNSLVYFLAMLLLSTSLIGDILIYFLSFVRFLSLTLIVCYIYSTYSLTGMEYCVLVFLPGKYLLIIASMLLINSCRKIVYSIRSKEKGIGLLMKNIAAKLATVLIFIITGALIDVLCIGMFFQLFSF